MLLLITLISQLVFSDDNKLELIRKIPHSGYSEGLDYFDGFLWNAFPKEIKKIDPVDGKVVETFAPGSTYSESVLIFQNKIWNVSFSDNGIYQADLKTKKFKRIGDAPDTHAWGLAHNGKEILMTGNYSNKIYFVNPKTLKVNREIALSYNGAILKDLEDLAYDGKSIWVSTFTSYRGQIFSVDPKNGDIQGIHTLPLPEECPVIDGLAYDGKALWITGKECPSLYQVKVPERKKSTRAISSPSK